MNPAKPATKPAPKQRAFLARHLRHTAKWKHHDDVPRHLTAAENAMIDAFLTRREAASA